MSTATMQDHEQYVTTPATSLVFMSRREDLRLVKVARQPLRNAATGAKEGETLGEALQFRDGQLRFKADGTVELDDGRVVDAEPIVEWLGRHKLLNSKDEGFWPVDPVAPAPNQSEIAALATLAGELNAEGLEAYIDQEQAGWGREALLEAAREQLGKVRATVELQDAEMREALEAAKAEGRAEAQRDAAKQDAANAAQPTPPAEPKE